ncbi:LysR family transcriptional regulator [Paenibacillus pectinilyticus]|uniref:LysR family transcriptional regulator n=1 Tax=Paenibacillus pectinilyticus TaxID=512399 RepID=A0A1C1A3L3_9BACL|nr:LysR family transcriptional regulator [Paenibacillus pectinilyticus]OCT15152.1 LysR family transcriptional regulator [Paenibacillus pectinilyticus]
MNLLSLRYFIVIAEYLSFTKASAHLFITQPTLSRQILDLEEELGVQLFVRGRHSLSLTKYGVRFLPEATEIIRKCDNIREIVRKEDDDDGSIIGLLSIGYQGFLDTKLMHHTLKSVAKKHPRIDFSLSGGSPPELRHHLLINKCDVVFALNSCVANIPNIACIKLQANELQIAVPRNHRLSKYDSIDMKELANEDFIMLERKISPFTVDYATSLCMKNGFSPNASYYVDDAEKALLLVGSGKGITFLHSANNINRPDETYDIKVLSIEGIDNNLDFVLAFKRDHTNPIIPIFVSELMSFNEPNN